MRTPGAVKLVAARAIASVMETSETLYDSQHLVIASLEYDKIFMRPDYSSALLKDLHCFPEGKCCVTAGWPMYSNKWILSGISLADSYVAAISTFTDLLAREAWTE